MAQNTNTPPSDPVAREPKQNRLNKRQIFIAAGVMFALVIVGVAAYLFIQWRNTQNTIDYSKVPEDVARLNEAVKPAEEGNLEETTRSLDELINKTENAQEKESLYTAKSNVCATYEDYECAIANNDRALEINANNVNVLINNGNYAYALGQKERGDGYYQRAIDLLSRDDSPEARLTITRLQQIIDSGASQEPDA